MCQPACVRVYYIVCNMQRSAIAIVGYKCASPGLGSMLTLFTKQPKRHSPHSATLNPAPKRDPGADQVAVRGPDAGQHGGQTVAVAGTAGSGEVSSGVCVRA